MMNDELAKEIEQQALAHGFSACGIISLDDMDGYAKMYEERMENVPESRPFYSRPEMQQITQVKKRFPWAKSLIICTTDYTRYRFPKELRNKFAKAFLLSRDGDTTTELYRKKHDFTRWLTDKGLRWEGGDDTSHLQIGGLRYAAMKAGLGIIRRNNFFYNENGCYVELDGYAIDAECRLYHHADIRPCSDRCNLCQKACPSHALQGPNKFSPLRCVSFCNTFGLGWNPMKVTDEEMGTWTIGCDACQDACPYNRRKNWDEGEPFPNLEELVPYFDLERLQTAPAEEIIEKVLPKTQEHIFPNQVNLLRESAKRAMKNSLGETLDVRR